MAKKLSGKVTASFEPSQANRLLYLPVAIMKPPQDSIDSGMVNFSLKLSYKAAPSGPKSLDATTLKVRWNTGFTAMTYPVTGTLEDGGTLDFFLDDLTPKGNSLDGTRGSMWIPTALAAIRIEVTFKNFEPVTLKDWPVQAHYNQTHRGSYAFPFKAKDLAENEYIFADSSHFPSASQHWGYDFKGYVWNGSKFVTSTGPKNEDHPIFERPVYAVAKALVLKAVDGWDDHTNPPLRNIIRAAVLRGPAGVISVAAADPDRIFTGITDDKGKLRLLSFAAAKDSRSVKFLARSKAGEEFNGTALSTTALSRTQVVVAGADNGDAFVSLYWLTSNGLNIISKNTVTLANTGSIRIARCSATQFLMARQPQKGNLEVSIWDVGSGLPQKPTTAVRAAGFSSNVFDLAVIDDDDDATRRRAVTALRRVSGKLKVIVWNLGFDVKTKKVTTLTRAEDLSVDDKVDQISVSGTEDDGRILVGTQNDNGNLASYYFQIDPDTGLVTLLNSEVGGPISGVALARFKRGQTAVAMISKASNAKLIGYEIRENEDTGVWEMLRTADYTDTGGAVEAIDIARIVPNDGEDNIESCAVAVRTSSGKLKVILWRQPQSNTVCLLSGNECVFYVHLRNGSVKVKAGAEVKEGDLIGQAGVSGPAGGPHLHIHCEKLNINSNSLTPMQLAQIQSRTFVIPSGSPRPMLFHGVSALAISKLGHKGWKNEPFVNVEDKGFYFEKVAIYPKLKP